MSIQKEALLFQLMHSIKSQIQIHSIQLKIKFIQFDSLQVNSNQDSCFQRCVWDWNTFVLWSQTCCGNSTTIQKLDPHNFYDPDGTLMQLWRWKRGSTTGDVPITLFCVIVYFFVFMSFHKKLTHVGNRSKFDNSFKSKKVMHNFCGDHKINLLF